MQAMTTFSEHAATLEEPPLGADVDLAAIGPYHGYAEQVRRLCELERRGARASVAAQSIDGEPIVAFEIGAAGAPRVAVLLAGIHPIEWIGVEVAMATLERLLDRPPDDLRVIAFPLINVDGYRRVERDLRRTRRRFVRGNARGVDLNRNWPVHFRKRLGPTSLLAGWNHGGAHAMSEPEVAAVVQRLDTEAATARITRAMSLHSIGRKVLYPYGGRWAPPARSVELRRHATDLIAGLPQRYSVTQSSRWVPGAFAHGMEIDTLHDRYGADALLVECSLGGASLRRPASLAHPFRWFNPADPAGEIAALAPAIATFLTAA